MTPFSSFTSMLMTLPSRPWASHRDDPCCTRTKAFVTLGSL
ncbi:MAG: hypothetical protein R3F43_14260 [bacterium]